VYIWEIGLTGTQLKLLGQTIPAPMPE
jgi:hypothetical protein